MSLPPLWKAKRELQRLGRQIRANPGFLYEYFFLTSRYDRQRAQLLKRFEGAIAETAKVAIYLIYPATGLLRSHLLALDYLASKGYAPLVVSNLPLSDADRETLLPHCWSYLERPNLGYDFGGYRDAMIELAPRLGGMERLAVFNDSCWFPLPGAGDWIDMAEAMDVDFAAAASFYGASRSKPRDFPAIRWQFSTGHRNFHYTSFALLLRPAVFRHGDFLGYWRRLRLAEVKSRTVRRGEIGFSQWAIRQGFSHRATLDIAHLDRDLNALPEDRLREIARKLIIPENRKMRDLRRTVTADSADKARLIALILFTVTRQGSSYSLAEYSIHDRGHPFLKKSPVWLDRESSDITLEIAARLEGPAGQIILEEVQELRRTRGKVLDAA